MTAAAVDAKDKGFDALKLTVLEGNDRALAFYAKAGFTADDGPDRVDGMGGKQAIPRIKRL